MKTNSAGLAIIKSFESCRLKAYPDPGTGAEPWTIGWGHAGEDVYPGLTWSQERADGTLLRDIEAKERLLDAALTVEISGNAYSALVSFAYNVKYKEWRGSTLLRLVNSGDMAGAAEQFDRWNLSGGRVMRGLVRRRAAERALFETPGDGEPVAA